MVLLVALLFAEVVLTLWDFVVEDWIRKPLGGVYAGERVMHGIMGIVYGAMLANMVPTLRTWWARPTGFVYSPAPISEALRWVMTLMAVGVFFLVSETFARQLEYVIVRGPGSVTSNRAQLSDNRFNRALDIGPVEVFSALWRRADQVNEGVP